MLIAIEKFPAHLKTITASQWNSLFSMIPEIERTEVFGRMVESRLQPDGSYSFPYWSEAKIIEKVSELLFILDLMPVFDWMKWEKGSTLLYSNDNFEEYDMITLCKLLTSAERLNRFSDGALVGIYKQGIIVRILKALQHHVRNNNFPEEPGWFSTLLSRFRKRQ